MLAKAYGVSLNDESWTHCMGHHNTRTKQKTKPDTQLLSPTYACSQF